MVWRLVALIVLMGLVVGLGPGAQAQGVDDLAALRQLVNPEILHFQRKDAEAVLLTERYVALARHKYGEDHTEYATAIFWLATVYQWQGRHAEAELLYKRALAIREKALGPDHAEVGAALDNLATLYDSQGRTAEAEPLYKRAIAVREKALGTDDFDVGRSLNSLAGLYWTQGRYAEAEPLYERSLAISEKIFGNGRTYSSLVSATLGTLDRLATLHFEQRDWARAAYFLRRSTDTIIQGLRRTTGKIDGRALMPDLADSRARAMRRILLHGERRLQAGRQQIYGNSALTKKAKSEAEQSKQQFWKLAKADHRLALQLRDSEARFAREVFETLQWSLGSEAARSLMQMAVRGAKGNSAMSALVRERQDLAQEWFRIPAYPRDQQDERENIARISTIDARLGAIDTRLAHEFPTYASLASPTPLSVEEVQKELDTTEALLLFFDTPELRPTPEETFIWVVTKTDVRWVRSELGTAALSREVAALRCGLDYDGAWGVTGSRCAQLLNVTYSDIDHRLGKPLPFDLARAHALYKALFGEVEDLIKDKHLLVVPSGPLTQLPFHVLVTTKPEAPTPDRSEYSKIAWFAGSHAITVLPAVSSLKALRQYAKLSQATKPLLGVGNPLLDGPDSRYADLKQAALKRQSCGDLGPVRVAENRGGGGVKPFAQRSGIADVADLRMALPLPETADELCDVAKAVGAAEADILLGARASEREIKRLSEAGTLRTYRIVHFATHGALAGEVSATAEPGLLLTPPKIGTEVDDGYLSASEIAGLKLDADWVILSACNTAAGEAKGAEALSGLARAFFYAGARALLVSHWYVDSNATVALIKGAFAELKANPDIGRAEALRRSMLAMIHKGAPPAAWAPFVVVGEGGAAR